MREKSIRSSVLKRKLFAENTEHAKRSRNTDKENPSTAATTQHQYPVRKRGALANITNITAPPTHPTTSNPAAATTTPNAASTSTPVYKTYAFTAAEFECEPVLSYKACLKLVGLCFSYVDHAEPKSTSRQVLAQNNAKLVELLNSKVFNEYVLRVVEKKLAALADQKEHIYDPERLKTDDVFLFVSYLWSAFVTRINGVAVIKPKSHLAHMYTDLTGAQMLGSSRYNPKFIETNTILVRLCQTIWRVASAQHKIRELVCERHFWSRQDEVTHACTLLANCTSTIKCMFMTKSTLYGGEYFFFDLFQWLTTRKFKTK